MWVSSPSLCEFFVTEKKHEHDLRKHEVDQSPLGQGLGGRGDHQQSGLPLFLCVSLSYNHKGAVVRYFHYQGFWRPLQLWQLLPALNAPTKPYNLDVSH